MKKTVSAAVGGRNFILDEDAYNSLGNYLSSFKAGLGNNGSQQEIMDELEMRIADLFREKLQGKEVVDINIVDSIVVQLGMPDWKAEEHNGKTQQDYREEQAATKKFFRDTDDKMIGGVCSGLALYLNVDVVIIRILFVVALLAGSAGFWLYIIICLIAPAAHTAAEKCEMRGIPATAENIRRFSGNNYRK